MFTPVLFSRIVYAVIALCLFCSVPTILQAQLNDINFEQKAASSLYDEWGFLNGSAVTLDGKAIVSNATGQLSYSYPVSSHTVKGVPIQTTLNYSGSVGFTSFKEYGSAYYYQVSSGNYTTDCPNRFDGWAKFTMNRPAWILGVNGFAVQVLGATHGYATSRTITDQACRSEFTHEDLVWAIDGYDFCNRMESLESTEYNGSKVDVIRLLRSDGSVLELYNSSDESTSGSSDALYTGHYHENTPNASGFAIVEYDVSLMPSFAQESTNYAQLKSRKVRYYPGDGTEYVFRERVAPFGTMEYFDDAGNKHRLYDGGRRVACVVDIEGFQQNIPEGLILGGAKASPTIFYLDEIRSAQGLVTSFGYSRHASGDNSSSRGRAQIQSFSGHRFSFGDGQVLINALGRTISLVLGKSVTTGVQGEFNPDGDVECPLGTFESQSDYYSNNRYDWNEVSKSTLGYVTKIVEQVDEDKQRTTEFDYDTYERLYNNWNFPHSGGNQFLGCSQITSSADVYMRLKDLRLSEVEEPSRKYTFCYFDGLDDYSCSGVAAPEMSIRPDAPIDLAAQQSANPPFSYNKSEFPYLRNNVVRSVKKYATDQTLLTTTTHSYTFPRDNNLSEYRGVAETSSMESVDHIANETLTTDFTYTFDLLPKIRNHLVRGSFSDITKVVETDGNQTTTTYTTFSEGVLSTYTYLPATRAIKVEQTAPVATSALKSAVQFSYTMEQLRDYNGELADYLPNDPTLASVMGKEVLEQTATEMDPSTVTNGSGGEPDVTTGTPYRVGVTKYRNFPYVVAPFNKSSVAWDEEATLENYNSSHASTQKPFEKAAFDPGVVLTKAEVLGPNVAMPPVVGLVEESYIKDPGGNYLRGTFNTFETDAYDAVESTFRGMLLSEKTYGPGKLTELPGNHYRYSDWWNRSLPTEVENANGAVAHSYFDFEIPDLYDPGTQSYDLPEGLIKRNNDLTISQELPSDQYFAKIYEEPVASEARVRKYDQSGTLSTEVLRAYQELTFGGNSHLVIDENGWVSRSEYDSFGRLQMAWLPYDFPEPEPAVTDRSLRLNRTSKQVRRLDDVQCNNDGTGKEVIPGTTTSTFFDNLVASNTVVPIPDCPECEVGQTSCSTEFIGFQEITGYLDYTVQSGDKLEPILASELDKAHLRLVVTGATPCSTLEIDIPILGFRKSYLLNCEQVEGDGGGSGGSGTVTTGGDPDKEGSTVQNSPGPGNGYFYVDLMEAKNAIESLIHGSHVEIFLRSKNPNATITFAHIAQATEPLLYLEGNFSVGGSTEMVEDGDYTLALNVDDQNLTSEILAKVDDQTHTAQTGSEWPVAGELRHTKVEHQFGHDYSLKHTDVYIGDPDAPTRIDRSEFQYDGRANVTSAKDAEGNVTTSVTDAFGRPDTRTNADLSTVESDYQHGTPTDAGLTSSDPDYTDYFGYAYVEKVTDEEQVPAELYYDAFDRLVRHRTYMTYPSVPVDVLYEYDLLDQVISVTHPDGRQTDYIYDDFGRVRSKRHPDLGLTSYAYDNLGNVRFVQSEQQAQDDRMTFYEYDDLNRMTLVGEAVFSDQSHPGIPVGPPGGGRWTDYLNPTVLHDDNSSAILTANITAWLDPAGFGQTVPNYSSVPQIKNCFQIGSQIPEAVPPFIVHTAETFSEVLTPSTQQDFENLAKRPYNVRMAIHYDELPQSYGPIWQHFPSMTTWNALAPTGTVRNLKGREVAVAYREHGGQPYHFSVMSYDERGRVEALLRYTENLGFDAVYYQYNSMNQLIATTTADPTRQHTTWYGYDANGRVEKVWTELGNNGSGLGSASGSPSYPSTPLVRPVNPDITYAYTKTGQVDQMFYPGIGVDVDYTYNKRRWLQKIDADQNGSNLFYQLLTHKKNGVISRQRFRHGNGPLTTQNYTNDDRQQLTDWTTTGVLNPRTYVYDNMGNRRIEGGMLDINGNSIQHMYEYNDPNGPNRLSDIIVNNTTNQTAWSWLTFSYDGNGSLVQKKESNSGGALIARENYAYSSWRNLLSSYERVDLTLPGGSNTWGWEYRYNAMGEREQKRATVSPGNDIALPNDYNWSYYLLGGGREQRALYRGAQTSQTVCGNPGGSQVYFYPEEYLVYGVEYPGALEDVPHIRHDLLAGKEYRITDHLASVRVTLDATGTTTNTYDYEPFGGILNPGPEARQGFNSREKDQESDLFNNGVRKLSDDFGRFTSVDPLWEEFDGWSPYQYGYNNPLTVTDPSGMQGRRIDMTPANLPTIEPTGGGGSMAGSTGARNSGGGRSSSSGKTSTSSGSSSSSSSTSSGGKKSTTTGSGSSSKGPMGGSASGGHPDGLPDNSGVNVLSPNLQSTRTGQTASGTMNMARAKTSVGDLIKSSTRGRSTKGKSTLFHRSGGLDQANKDFDALNPTDIKNIDGGRVGKLSDGRRVVVRNKSKDGRPTLEVQKNSSKIKFRYNE